MSVYRRYKQNPEGFRALVELLESTPPSRRKKMLDVGYAEDVQYTDRALAYVMTFDDIIHLPDPELAEVLAKSNPRILAYALHGLDERVVDRFFRNAPPAIAIETRSYMDIQIGSSEINGAQIKIIATARSLEKQGLVKTKHIPARI